LRFCDEENGTDFQISKPLHHYYIIFFLLYTKKNEKTNYDA